MNTKDNAGGAAGRAMGAVVSSGFGTLWLIAAMSFIQRLNAATLSAVVGIGVTLALTAGWLLKRAPKSPDDPGSRERRKQVGRRFGLINGVQWTAILLAIVLLNVFRKTDYIAPVIAMVVGLHFFPLANLFQNRSQYVVGAAILALAVGSVLVLRGQRMSSFAAIGAGITLLLSSIYGIVSASRMLAQARSADRMSEPSMQ